MRRDITKVRVWDAVPAAVVLILACVMLFTFNFSGGAADTVYITSDNGTVAYPIDSDKTVEISSGGHALTVEIKSGEARVTASDCPDKTCVRSSAVTKDGGTIICVPARVIIKTEGGDGDDLDWTAP